MEVFANMTDNALCVKTVEVGDFANTIDIAQNAEIVVVVVFANTTSYV